MFMRIVSTIIVLCAGLALRAQTAATSVIDVNEPRPLASSLDALERIVHAPINYEDPPYENETDLMDVATAQDRAANPGFRQLVPRAGHVTALISFPAAGASLSGALASATTLLDSYRQNFLPGGFEVVQSNGVTFVTPSSVMGAAGTVKKVTSPLLTIVTVPNAQRTVSDTLKAILEAVNQGTGLKIVAGTLPFRPTDQISFGVTGVTARDAILRLFAQTGKSLSYRLLFDPLPDKMRIFDYMMNVHPVGYVSPTPPVNSAPAPVSINSSGPNPAFVKQ
jgi:hypothetical protein